MKLIYKEGEDHQYNVDPNNGMLERQVMAFHASTEYPSRGFYIIELRQYIPTMDSVVERWDDYSQYTVTIPDVEYKVIDDVSTTENAVIRAAIRWYDTGEWKLIGG